MMNKEISKTLILGGSGLVGSEVTRLWQDKKQLSTPSHSELDVTDKSAFADYLRNGQYLVVINFVGHTNLVEAEKQRGDKKNSVWQLNVEVVSNVAQICAEFDSLLIHISTDAVFPGTEKFPGPYDEKVLPIDDPEPLNWYGYTKLKGEQAIRESSDKAAIVRISHPFGNSEIDRDFAQKVITYIKLGYTLFNDQYFTPTYLPDLAATLEKIANGRNTGIYHVACHPLNTPFQFAEYIAYKKDLHQVKVGHINEWTKANPDSYPRVKLGGLKTDLTQKALKLEFHHWQKALDEFFTQHSK